MAELAVKICPVAAILSYVAIRCDQPGPFFLKSTNRPLSKEDFLSEVCGLLNTLGVPLDQCASHSFRIGAAMSAALAGVENSTIQLLGWQSAAFHRYIRTPQEELASVAAAMASQGQTSRWGWNAD